MSHSADGRTMAGRPLSPAGHHGDGPAVTGRPAPASAAAVDRRDAVGSLEQLAAATVLGIGNLIAGDDGFGVHALHALQARFACGADADRVEFVDGGVLGLELLTVVESADRLLVLDAVDAGTEPGAVVELPVDGVAVPRTGRLSVHQVVFNDLVALARLRGRLPREFVLFGVQPVSTATSDRLTGPVAAALPEVVARAERVLRRWMAAA
jgi:hydrogenase maturation protease